MQDSSTLPKSKSKWADISKEICELRKELVAKEVRQKQVADFLGISNSSLSRIYATAAAILTGKFVDKNPFWLKEATISKIPNALRVVLEYYHDVQVVSFKMPLNTHQRANLQNFQLNCVRVIANFLLSEEHRHLYGELVYQIYAEEVNSQYNPGGLFKATYLARIHLLAQDKQLDVDEFTPIVCDVCERYLTTATKQIVNLGYMLNNFCRILRMRYEQTHDLSLLEKLYRNYCLWFKISNPLSSEELLEVDNVVVRTCLSILDRIGILIIHKPNDDRYTQWRTWTIAIAELILGRYGRNSLNSLPISVKQDLLDRHDLGVVRQLILKQFKGLGITKELANATKDNL